MPQDDIEKQVKQELSLRYLNQAIGGTENIPWRIATRLLDIGLIDDLEVADTVYEQIINILCNDPEYLSHHCDPLFILSGAQRKELKFGYIELTDLLGWRDIKISKLVAPVLKRIVKEKVDSKNINSLTIDYCNAVETDDFKNILIAAALLDEALTDNWDWKVITLKQASKNNIEHIIRRQIPRLFNVNLIEDNIITYLQQQFESVISLFTEKDKSTKTKPPIQKTISKLAPVASHLPWRENIGIAAIFNNNYTSEEINNAWPDIEHWLDVDKPASWFNIWFAAITHPQHIPEHAWPNIWRKLMTFIGNNYNDFENESINAKRYLKLSQFYIYRLESNLPSCRSEFIYWSASKLASDVLSSLPIDDAQIDELIDVAVEDSKLAWQLATPEFPQSAIRSTFITFDNYWYSAFQSSISLWENSKFKDTINIDDLSFLKLFIKNMALKLDISDEKNSDDISMLLIDNVSNIQNEWINNFDDDEEINVYINGHNELIEKFNSSESVMDRISKPFGEKDTESVTALMRLSVFLRDGSITIESMFRLISSNDWKNNVEPTIPVEHIYNVISSLLTCKWSNTENVHVNLPHWAVQQCVAYFDDEKRREIYFVAVVLFCIKNNTSSAVSRIIFEDKANVLSANKQFMRNTLIRLLPISPGGLSGKIRAILAAL